MKRLIRVATGVILLTALGAAPVTADDGALHEIVSDALAVIGDEPLVGDESGELARLENVTLRYTGDGQSLGRATNDYLQVIAVIDSGDTATYEVEGLPSNTTLEPVGDGSLAVVQELSDGAEVLGIVSAPWAVDDNGVELATEYEVQGSTLDDQFQGVAAGVSLR